MICWRQLDFWRASRIFGSERIAGGVGGKVKCAPLEIPRALGAVKVVIERKHQNYFRCKRILSSLFRLERGGIFRVFL